MSGLPQIEYFNRARERGAALVLATVVETAGSTYTKPGQRMLIGADGSHHGLVSGGCLEGDLVLQAAAVFAGGAPRLVTYDMRRGDDDLWGLGIGCNGMLRLLLQRLDAAHDYEPFATLAGVLTGEQPADLRLVVESSLPALPVGATLLDTAAGPRGHGLDTAAAARLRDLAPVDSSASRARRSEADAGGARLTLLTQRLRPLPRALVFGAGPDAVPVVGGFQALGWRVAVCDHRDAWLARAEFASVPRHAAADPASVAALLAAAPVDVAVVMSHNLEADARCLGALATVSVPYVGLLGPPQRRERLLERLDPAAARDLRPRLHGPAGLDIGADSPASIAVSIVAEAFAALHGAALRRTPGG